MEYPDVIRVEEHRRSIMEQLSAATLHLHKLKFPILHRDISDETVLLQWEYREEYRCESYIDARPTVRVRLSHFIHSRVLSQNEYLVKPPSGPKLQFLAPEEFIVPSVGPRKVGLKADIWRMQLIFRLLHGLHVNTLSAEDEFDMWVETFRLVPVRYGRQDADYITPLPKLINAMSSLVPECRWDAFEVLGVIHQPGTAHHLPHPPLVLLKSIPDPTTQYPRYDPVVQKLCAPTGFGGGDNLLQPAILVVPHLGRVWTSTSAVNNGNNSAHHEGASVVANAGGFVGENDTTTRCPVCMSPFLPNNDISTTTTTTAENSEDGKKIRGGNLNALSSSSQSSSSTINRLQQRDRKYVCLSCGNFHQRRQIFDDVKTESKTEEKQTTRKKKALVDGVFEDNQHTEHTTVVSSSTTCNSSSSVRTNHKNTTCSSNHNNLIVRKVWSDW
eukprot:TRINITY_DN13728_c0_g1_i1.p1 TRINITY_DN13728_c0_g1~~TRINITY_DN13728_c0_g1_i1.p1  ORF type:complete len:443 (+),score=32.10 TRINITY_DN13728_c0_g1_i1:777-2105(+)